MGQIDTATVGAYCEYRLLQAQFASQCHITMALGGVEITASQNLTDSGAMLRIGTKQVEIGAVVGCDPYRSLSDLLHGVQRDVARMLKLHGMDDLVVTG